MLENYKQLPFGIPGIIDNYICLEKYPIIIEKLDNPSSDVALSNEEYYPLSLSIISSQLYVVYEKWCIRYHKSLNKRALNLFHTHIPIPHHMLHVIHHNLYSYYTYLDTTDYETKLTCQHTTLDKVEYFSCHGNNVYTIEYDHISTITGYDEKIYYIGAYNLLLMPLILYPWNNLHFIDDKLKNGTRKGDPCGICFYDDIIYVIDDLCRLFKIKVDSFRNKNIDYERIKLAKLKNPIFIKIYREKIYIVDKELASINAYDLDGNYLHKWHQIDEICVPTSVAFKDNKMYVLSSGNHTINMYKII